MLWSMKRAQWVMMENDVVVGESSVSRCGSIYESIIVSMRLRDVRIVTFPGKTSWSVTIIEVEATAPAGENSNCSMHRTESGNGN